MNSQQVLDGILLLIGLKAMVELFLGTLNRRHIQLHAGEVPSAFEGVMDEPTYQKATQYSLSKSRFGALSDVLQVFFYAFLLTQVLLPVLFKSMEQVLGTGVWGLSAMTLLAQVAFMVPFLPLDWWSQFRIEASYGFNRSTQALWWIDRVKGFVLMMAIGVPLLAAIFFLYQKFPHSGWWMAAALMGVFQVVLMLVYPRFILPIFNKLTPLEEGPLKARIMALADRLNFKAQTIEVIDGSKRSGHSNAFFTGFGRFRRIVFFDTLLQQLSHDELEAVLAHEIGHYRHGHVLKHLVLNMAVMLGAFWLMHIALQSPLLFSALGFAHEEHMFWLPALIVLGGPILGSVFFWLKPFLNAYSRKHEYEADAFARNGLGGDPKPLIQALRKLHKENLSNLTPHPLFSAFYYSHPTLLERESALLRADQ